MRQVGVEQVEAARYPRAPQLDAAPRAYAPRPYMGSHGEVLGVQCGATGVVELGVLDVDPPGDGGAGEPYLSVCAHLRGPQVVPDLGLVELEHRLGVVRRRELCPFHEQ